MIPEGEDRPPSHEPRSPEIGGRDVLAERRARRLGAAASADEADQVRRAERAEATASALERKLAELRRHYAEAERERETAEERLADRDHELRRAKQREYAEQQLRVEAEESLTRLRRRHRAELERLQRHVQDARAAMHATGERAEELRTGAEHGLAQAERRSDAAERRLAEVERRLAQAERRRALAEESRATLAARLDDVGAGCERMRLGVLGLERAAASLRADVDSERLAGRARGEALERERDGSRDRTRELERALQIRREASRAEQRGPADAVGETGAPSTAGSLLELSREARREEVSQALAAAVERLRAKIDEPAPPVEPAPLRSEPPPVERRAPHKHSMSLVARLKAARKHRRQRR